MYKSKLNIKETQKAIKIVKDTFENKLAETFNLDRVSAPIIVSSKQLINDDLGIKDSALKFHIETLNEDVEIVQSLAKWKRIALKNYGYDIYEGIYTDMNAIRPKDILDQTHSLYVDQWDWELIITNENRNIKYLKQVVRKIVLNIKETKELIKTYYPNLKEDINEEVFFISFKKLEEMYPNKSISERERAITKKHKSVFVTKIGEKEDKRAPDYDDWNLNGDILIWSDALNDAVEISSMGIRVNDLSLQKQMKFSKRENDLKHEYYNLIINNKLPLTIGGGIGQSRLCMILLEKIHIAEVQASIWDEKELEFFKNNNIKAL